MNPVLIVGNDRACSRCDGIDLIQDHLGVIWCIACGKRWRPALTEQVDGVTTRITYVGWRSRIPRLLRDSR